MSASQIRHSGQRRISESTQPCIASDWRTIGSCLTVTALWLCNPKAASAQTQPAIVPDGTLGPESSVVVPDVEIRGIDSSRIDGGARRGANLFHSFQEFNIELNRGAFFSNPEGVDNILTRVTGSNLSTINGTLGVLGSANLFLINPNGLVFESGASLDINGSFFGSTAESVLFEAYGFSAVDPSAPPTLTLNVPIGLQFGENPGDIVVRSPLQELTSGEFTEMADAGQSVNTAQTVNSAGELPPESISGQLTASGDVDTFRLSLPEGTVLSASTVGGTTLNTTLTLFDAEGRGIAGNVNSQGTAQSTLPTQVIEESGEFLLRVSSNPSRPTSAGGEIFAPGIGDLSPNGPGADSPLSGQTALGNRSDFFTVFLSVTDPTDRGGLQVPPGETLALVGGEVTLADGGLIAPGGQVEVGGVGANGTALLTQVDDTVRLSFPEGTPRANVNIGNGSVLDVRADDGGSITINAEDLKISDRSALLAGIVENSGFAGARGGDVILNATGDIAIRGASSVQNRVDVGAFGNSGNIEIAASAFTLEGDARVDADLLGTGNAGLISIDADAVTIQGSQTLLESRVVNEDGNATGNAGSILIETDSFTLEDDARVTTNLAGVGNAGLISIEANEVTIRGSATRLVSRVDFGDMGDAGSISIVTDSFTLEDGARVLTNLGGIGNAGTISIDADEVAIRGEGTRLDSSADNLDLAEGDAGSISIVTNIFTLEDRAQVRTSLIGTGGDAGHVAIKADEVAIRGDGTRDGATQTRIESRVDRASVDRASVGNAGDILIEASSFTLEDGAIIDSSTLGFGNPGSTEIRADGAVILSDDATIFSQVDAGAIGEEGIGGRIAIDADSIELRDGGRLITSVREARGDLPGGQGNGGEVVLRARDSVLISGVDAAVNEGEIDRPSGIATVIGRQAAGNAGDISIETGSFTLADGAEVSSSAFGSGNSGNIEIRADRTVRLSNATILNQTNTTGSQDIPGEVAITAAEGILLDKGRITTAVEPGAEGLAGDIQLSAPDILLTNFSLLDTATFAQGFSPAGGAEGAVTLEAENSIVLENSNIFSITNGAGDAGTVTLRAGERISLVGESSIATASALRASGEGGDIRIETDGIFSIETGNIAAVSEAESDNSFLESLQDEVQVLEVVTTGENPDVGFSDLIPFDSVEGEVGPGQTQYFSFEVDAAGTRIFLDIDNATGPGVEIAILDSQGNLLDSNSSNFIPTEIEGEGSPASGGDAFIASPFSAPGTYVVRVSQQAPDPGDPPSSYTLQISLDSLFINNGGLSAQTNASEPSATAGNIDINANEVILGAAAQLSTETTGAGSAGDIAVTTPLLTIAENAQLSATVTGDSTSTQPGGNITLSITKLNISGQLGIFADTASAAPAGSITINPHLNDPNVSILFIEDGFISTETFSSGPGGEINISALQTLDISGDGNITASTAEDSTGASGSILLDAQTINIRDNASITVDSQGSAPGGDIEINARDLNLERGAITAETAGTDGGNIDIDLENVLVLRDESAITTSAGNAQAGGDGGRIEIDSLFVVAFPSNGPAGNDIFANAFDGSGGEIAIATEGLFGIAFSDLATPRDSASNDITVSSTFGLSGDFELVSPEVNPTDALTNLPTQTIAVQVFGGCQVAGGNGNSIAFYNLGNGGLPLSESPAREYGGALGTWTALEGTTAHTVPSDRDSVPEIAAAFRTNLRDSDDELLSARSSVKLIPTCWLF